MLGNRWFDGRGTFKATGMSNTGGPPVQETITGTYLVNAECEITLTYNQGGTNFSWFGGAYGSVSGFTLMQVDPGGAVIVGSMQLQ